MQRQSLGSTGSKLQINGDVGGEEEKRKGGSGAAAAAAAVAMEEEEEVELEKRIRWRSRPEKSVHLIPILTILCLLILYLCSHDPSPKDLEGFGAAGGMLAAKAISVEEIGRHIGADWGGVAGGIPIHRRLKEEAQKRRHRKLGII